MVVYIQIPRADAYTDDDDCTRKFNTGALFDLIVCSAASIEHVVVSLQPATSSSPFAAATVMPTNVCYLDPTVTAMLPIQTCRRRIQRNSRGSINNSPGACSASAMFFW